MLLGHIINLIEDRVVIEVQKPTSKSSAMNNHRNTLNFLNSKKKFPIKFLNSVEELYKSNPIFITEFLKEINNLYSNKTK